MASNTLYRKYRPQTFKEIVNQEHVKSTIQQELVSGKLPHAFLFYGPRGIGKTTTARILAKALNCKKLNENEPCNSCESCESLTKGASLNLVEVDAASQTGVDNVRENIIANARVSVKSDEYKVFIIDEVHMLSTSSFNALLKTLEEPPERVLFILATTELHKIPETIISRCQRFDFHPIHAQQLVEHLRSICEQEGREVEDAVLQSVVKKSGGHARDALSLLGQVLTLPGAITAESASMILPSYNIEHVVSLFDHLAKSEMAPAIQYLHDLEKKGYRAHHFIEELIECAHNLLLIRVDSHPDIYKGLVSEDVESQIKSIAQRFSVAQLLKIVDIFLQRRQQLKNLDYGILPLELAVVEIVTSLSAPVASVTPPPAAKPVVAQAPKPVSKPVASKPQEPLASAPNAIDLSALASAMPAKPAPVVEENVMVRSDLPEASFQEVQLIWPQLLSEMNQHYHSVFIVLRTGRLRESSTGEPELVFKYRMHHDHIKRHLGSIMVEAQKLLEQKTASFAVVVDQELEVQIPKGEVEEVQDDELESVGNDLQQLADAFGGAFME